MARTVRRGGFEWRQIRVAVLLLVGVVLLAYGVYRVGKIFDVFADRYNLITMLPSVAGLREGALVTLAGQRVGQIADIEFLPINRKFGGNHLLVTVEVSEAAREQIRRDSRVHVRAQGLLGDKYLDIQPGSAGVAIAQPGDTLVAVPLMDLEQFLTRASTTMDEAGRIMSEMRTITSGLARGEGTLGQLLNDEQLYFRMLTATAEMQTLLEAINNGEGTLARLIRDPTAYQRILAAVTRVDSLGTVILHGSGTLSQLIRSDSIYRSLAGSAQKADLAAGELASLLQRMNDSNGTLNRMITDPRLYDEFLKAVVDLQTMINDMRANPRKYMPDVNVKVF